MRKFFYIIFFITFFFVGSNAVNAATISEGIYTIKSALGNNKVLDVNGGNVANGTNVQLYSSNKTDSQRWYVKPVEGDYYEIISYRI